MANPTLIDWNLIEQTGLLKIFKAYTKKYSSNKKEDLAVQMKILLRLNDEADAIGRFNWKEIAKGIAMTSDEIERLLYFRGQLILWYYSNNDKFMITPFSGSGINFNGKFSKARPVPISLNNEVNNYDEQSKALDRELTILYEIPSEKELKTLDINKVCVIIRDYPCQLNNTTIISRAVINDPLLEIESEIFPTSRTARFLSTGVKGLRINDESEATNVEDANRKLENAVLSGEPYIPITGKAEFQDLQAGQATKGEDYMLALQTLENFRLSTYGIENGGLFNKKAHELESEESINAGPVEGRLERAYNCREDAMKIARAVFGINMRCEIAVKSTKETTKNEGENEHETDDSER